MVDWIALGLTGALVLITGYYAWATRKILAANEKAVAASRAAVDAMREQTEAVYRPYVTVTHRLTSDAALYLDVVNTGKTNAEKLKLDVDRDFWQLGPRTDNYNLPTTPAFSNVIESFPPGASLTFALGPGLMTHDDRADETETPLVFEITASYGFGGKRVDERTTVDLRPYAYTFTKPDPIEKQIKDLVSAWKDALRWAKQRRKTSRN